MRLGGRRLDAHLIALGGGQHVFASCAPGADLREEDYLELLWQCQVGVAVSLHATKVWEGLSRPSRAVEATHMCPHHTRQTDTQSGAARYSQHAFAGSLGLA